MVPETELEAAVDSALLRKDVELLTAKVEKLSQDVEELVTAWKTANYVVVFIKWIAGAAAAVATMIAFMKAFGIK